MIYLLSSLAILLNPKATAFDVVDCKKLLDLPNGLGSRQPLGLPEVSLIRTLDRILLPSLWSI